MVRAMPLAARHADVRAHVESVRSRTRQEPDSTCGEWSRPPTTPAPSPMWATFVTRHPWRALQTVSIAARMPGPLDGWSPFSYAKEQRHSLHPPMASFRSFFPAHALPWELRSHRMRVSGTGPSAERAAHRLRRLRWNSRHPSRKARA
jgi:hypothetical protein